MRDLEMMVSGHAYKACAQMVMGLWVHWDCEVMQQTSSSLGNLQG